MPRCSVIIPVYNKASLTRQCLDVLLSDATLNGDAEIIVVDDGSTDLTPELLAGYAGRIRVVTHAENKGFATACNDGALVAGGEFLVFLNNDTIPQPCWLDSLVSYADAHPRAAVVGCKLLFPNETVQHAGVVICQDWQPRHIYTGFPADHPAVNRSRRFQAVTAGCVLIRRGVFDEARGFDTVFLNGYEDVDLCLRLGHLGHEIHYCCESVVHHFASVSREALGHVDGRGAQEYLARWAGQVRQDEFDYYVEDGLLRAEHWGNYPWALFPIGLHVSPLLANLTGGREEKADELVRTCYHRISELIRENVSLSVRLKEAELKASGVASTDAGSSAAGGGGSTVAAAAGGGEALPRTDERAGVVACVAGMHRSGTSMVTRVLQTCGLYLGPERYLMPPAAQNPEGFWENMKFVEVNDGILRAFGAAWDRPPATPPAWGDERLAEARAAAQVVAGEFSGREFWGWKDPRGSVTLNFWRGLLPDLKTVIALRNPLEVAQSLLRRDGFPLERGLALWAAYNRLVLASSSPRDRVITHYESYFSDPEAEVRRVLNFIGLTAADELIVQACSTIRSELHHNRFTREQLPSHDLPQGVSDLYGQMCEEARWPEDAATRRATAVEGDGDAGEGAEYRLMVSRVREAVGVLVSADAKVLIVSRGDDELLKLESRLGWHFPQTPEGWFAGEYPADSGEAIRHLESLREKGADYLVVPQTYLWWLEHYREFAQHLESRYRLAWRDESCVIYQLLGRQPQRVKARPRQPKVRRALA